MWHPRLNPTSPQLVHIRTHPQVRARSFQIDRLALSGPSAVPQRTMCKTKKRPPPPLTAENMVKALMEQYKSKASAM